MQLRLWLLLLLLPAGCWLLSAARRPPALRQQLYHPRHYQFSITALFCV